MAAVHLQQRLGIHGPAGEAVAHGSGCADRTTARGLPNHSQRPGLSKTVQATPFGASAVALDGLAVVLHLRHEGAPLGIGGARVAFHALPVNPSPAVPLPYRAGPGFKHDPAGRAGGAALPLLPPVPVPEGGFVPTISPGSEYRRRRSASWPRVPVPEGLPDQHLDRFRAGVDVGPETKPGSVDRWLCPCQRRADRGPTPDFPLGSRLSATALWAEAVMVLESRSSRMVADSLWEVKARPAERTGRLAETAPPGANGPTSGCEAQSPAVVPSTRRRRQNTVFVAPRPRGGADRVARANRRYLTGSSPNWGRTHHFVACACVSLQQPLKFGFQGPGLCTTTAP